jgi:multicomponent Na+:H+ antiporter subunit G
MREWIVAGLLLAGAAFIFLAALGVARLPDLFTRMQAATKAGPVGVGCVLASVAVYFGEAGVATRVVLVIAFLLVTAPVAAHMIARSAYLVGVPLWGGTHHDELRRRFEATAQRPTEDANPEG